jgi:hypothetical protein
LVGKDIRDRICELLIYNSELSVPAGLVIAGKPSAFAQVLLTAPAVNAFPARMAQPCYADSLADLKSLRSCPELIDYPHDLMSRDDRMSREGQLTFDNVKVRAADAAGPYPDPDFRRAGGRIGKLHPLKRG